MDGSEISTVFGISGGNPGTLFIMLTSIFELSIMLTSSFELSVIIQKQRCLIVLKWFDKHDA